MAGDNSEQVAEWNGPLGLRWASLNAETDRIVAAFGDAALRIARAQAGERVIDIGCGCGDTSIVLSQAIGPEGIVLGVDVSEPMLAVARARASQLDLPQPSFQEGDAATSDLPRGMDLLFSRFGVMFFAAPVPAFAHLRCSLRDTGRMTFVCWRAPRENSWAMAPLIAARQALGFTAPPSDPFAPGPFAFADANRVRAILLEANFQDVQIDPFDAPVYLGNTPRSAAEGAARLGPLSRLIRETGADQAPLIVDAVETALAPLALGDGSVSLQGAAWIVSAEAG
ncbi:MAG: methyltransferase domain-containing protein [Alphaproteobacteria bacterium]|nr:methyltransferase domain-containing protein [Alphaproteobacteria bacterium]